jgi:peptidoglycan/xylan/chitin deacetylase (PgdA/CDA1 family)
VSPDTRDQIVKSIFEDHLSDEKSFSRILYISWEEARAMQTAGMIIGGHSHQHRPLATLSDDRLQWDLNTCQTLLLQQLNPQPYWPFSYPYGKKDSYSEQAVNDLSRLGFTCSFSTEVGPNSPATDLFALRRLDCKDAPI